MKVVILCGGLGSRIRGVSDDIPKPMIPIGDYPILWHIMKYYAHWKHEDFVLCLGYKSHVIKEFFLNYEMFNRDFTLSLGKAGGIQYHTEHAESRWRVTLAETGMEAMTGARIRKIRKYVAGEKHFMVTYGDGVGDIDLDKLIEFHRSHGKIMTLTGVRPPGRFGELLIGGDGTVKEFNEKPQASGGRISGGFFVCNAELFDYLPEGEDLVFEQEPMRALVRDGQLACYEHDGFWLPMDTPREYSLLNKLFAQHQAPWVIWK